MENHILTMYTQWFFLRQMADLTMKNIHIYTVSVYYVQYSMYGNIQEDMQRLKIIGYENLYKIF